jgi:hypothetical protein
MIIETNEKNWLAHTKQLVDSLPSLLDIGCGLCANMKYFDNLVKVGVDVHRPYLLNRVDRSPNVIPINIDATKISEIFLPKSFACVTFIDAIEHFPKETALQVLAAAEQIADTRVVVFTPRGVFPQAEFDYFKMGGEKFQAHHSGWEPEDFTALGYACVVYKGFHGPDNPSFVEAFGAGHDPVDALLAWKDASLV